MIRAMMSAMTTVLFFALVLSVAAGAFFWFPAFAQGTEGSCSALAVYGTKKANEAGDGPGTSPIARGAGRLMLSALIENELATEYPNVPPAAACSWLYWKAAMQPTPIVVRSTR